MKVGEVYIYDSCYSINIIKIREVYYDSYYKKASIKFDKLELYLDDKIYYYCLSSIRIESLDSIGFKRKSKKDWYNAVRKYNKDYWRNLE